MNSDKRLILAVALSFLILVFYPVYLKWVSPSAPPASESAQPVESAEAPGIGKPIPIQPSSPQTIAPVEGPLARGETLHQFSHTHFNVEFSDWGGAVTKLELKNWREGQANQILVDRSGGETGTGLINLPNQGIDFGNRVFSLQKLNEETGEVWFAAEIPGQWAVLKKFKFAEESPSLALSVEVKNLGTQERTAFMEITNQLSVGAQNHNDHAQPESFAALRDKLVAANIGKILKKPYVVEGEILWQALTRHYFTFIVKPDEPAKLAKTTAQKNGAEWMVGSLQLAPERIPAGGASTHSFLMYAGPQYYKNLKAFGAGFEQLLSNGFFGLFKLWLLVALQWAHNITGNYGWAIVLITAAIKLLFTPLTHMSYASMGKMQALQPKLKSLQERHKGDQAKLSQEMMQLYKQHKVNPMSGCLPMVLQIPVFIAFYQVLAQTVELKGEPFIFWMKDLSAPDSAWTLPFSLPFLGDAVNILPLLMIGSMIWQQRLTPATGTSDQQKIMMFMPVVFGFIFYGLPSGLVLYWFLNNMLTIFHQLFIKGKALPHHEAA